MPNADDKVPAIVRNEWFYFIARFCMILGTTVGIPVLGVLGSRVITSADAISIAVNEQSIQLRLLTAEMRLRLENNEKNNTDHELRLRQLERERKP